MKCKPIKLLGKKDGGKYLESTVSQNVLRLDTEYMIPEAKWSCSVMSNSATPWTVAYQTPPSMEFSWQEYWSGFPCSTAGIFLTQGSNPLLFHLWHCRQILYFWVIGTCPKQLIFNMNRSTIKQYFHGSYIWH